MSKMMVLCTREMQKVTGERLFAKILEFFGKKKVRFCKKKKTTHSIFILPTGKFLFQFILTSSSFRKKHRERCDYPPEPKLRNQVTSVSVPYGFRREIWGNVFLGFFYIIKKERRSEKHKLFYVGVFNLWEETSKKTYN